MLCMATWDTEGANGKGIDIKDELLSEKEEDRESERRMEEIEAQ